MKVKVTTTSRVDFAGGTLDLYPLYLFMDGGVTVNASISLYSEVEIKTRNDSKILITSRDLKVSEQFENLEDMNLEGPTSLIQRAVRSFSPGVGMEVATHNQPPPGSGLGASSSLLVALCASLAKVTQIEMDTPSLVDRCAAIEAAHLKIPTGKQDYYGAILGGINSLLFDERGCIVQNLAPDESFTNQLNSCLLISYTGMSHYSGANNWDMLRMFIEDEGTTRRDLFRIKEISRQIRDAFLNKDVEKVGYLVGREWECRKSLAPGVTNDFIDEVIETLHEAGAWGSKLCGAGGGGCMITLAPARKMEKLREIMKHLNVTPLKAGIVSEGIEILREDGVKR